MSVETAAPVVESSTPTLINLKALAKRTGLPVAYLKRQTDKGNIPALRASGKTLYSENAVSDALQAAAAQSSPREPKKRGPRKRTAAPAAQTQA